MKIDWTKIESITHDNTDGDEYTLKAHDSAGNVHTLVLRFRYIAVLWLEGAFDGVVVDFQLKEEDVRALRNEVRAEIQRRARIANDAKLANLKPLLASIGVTF